jgi:hypothetical protein
MEWASATGRFLVMKRWIPAVVLTVTTFASTSNALAPGDAARGFREGANHHVGDDSFITELGRAPNGIDTEATRMHLHFTYVRRWLASRPATKPELMARRQEILGHFDEYIAKGTTPLNVHVPWRSPVFIDDQGTICAVGYLIEKTAGRPLAERVAREHRYSVLEDIAAAMPEVRAWVETSGLTLEELASIQPGYIPPATWSARDVVDDAIDFTPIALEAADGSGTWRSRYPAGERLAEGRYSNKRPEGAWRFYYPSGNLAASGGFSNGLRDGRWTFFHDSKDAPRMSVGSFMSGTLIEEWRHFDETGKLVARTRPASPVQFGGAGYILDVIPREGDHVHHWVHQANVAGMKHRLDYLADGREQIYVREGEEEIFDVDGRKLTRVDGGWQSSDCHWSHVRKNAAHAGDIVTLNELLVTDDAKCGVSVRVPDARARRIDAMMSEAPLRAVETIRAQLAVALVKPRV